MGQVSSEEQNRLKVGQLLIYTTKRRVFFKGKEYDVTTKEFDLLSLLAEYPEKAFSREELLVKVWGDDYFGSDRAVDDLIKRLRKKIPHIPVETIWGYGYRLNREEDKK